MVTSNRLLIGLTRRFTVMYGLDSILVIGRKRGWMIRTSLEKGDGLRCASPILRGLDVIDVGTKIRFIVYNMLPKSLLRCVVLLRPSLFYRFVFWINTFTCIYFSELSRAPSRESAAASPRQIQARQRDRAALRASVVVSG